jgi:hypothetical protein
MSEYEQSAESNGSFSRAKLRLKNYVDGLALLESGSTPDVIRTGSLELWPGCIMVAEVLNPNPAFHPDIKQLIAEGWVPIEEDIEPIYALTVYDSDGNERESLAINAWSGHVIACAEESVLFEPGKDAPDYMIESFFRRYWLDHGPMSLAESNGAQ